MANWLSDYNNRVAQETAQAQPYHERGQSLAAQYARSTSHLYSIRTAVVIPLLQSFIMGLGFGAIAGVTMTMIETEIPEWFVFFAVLCIAFVITWYFRLSDWRRIVGKVERLVDRDINGDGVVGYAPEPEPEEEEAQKFIHIELISEDGRRGQFFDIPDYPWMQLFARKVLNGTPLSYTEWTGSGKYFSRGEFEHLQNLLVEQNLAVWRDPSNHRNGMILKLAGREVFMKLADDNYSPTLPD